uniref:PH domain-containing protein n=1 Tax=Melopsittacus undulatus TaxID=13146 RepID=A0A8V5G4Q1_MELUD
MEQFNLSCGWLKKQRSIMKNWQQRWFVLQNCRLISVALCPCQNHTHLKRLNSKRHCRET